MKKILIILISALMAILLLASCSGVTSAPLSKDSNTSGWGAEESYSDGAVPPMASEVGRDYENDTSYNRARSDESGVVPVTAPAVDDSLAEKIIYTVNADIQTIDFDATIEGVYNLLTTNGGFIEGSNIGGRSYAQSYNSWQTFRTAQFSLRIPKDRLNAVTASLGALGNVMSLRSDAENVTSQFYDTQSRLNSYKIQEERLLDMLAKSENVPDMITIEERLADIRYQIETLTTTLRNWQNKVDYSTLNLHISEVEILSEISPVQQKTYWEQVSDGLGENAKGVGRFFKELFKWLVVNLPVLGVLAVIAVVVIIIVKRLIRRSAKKAKQKPLHKQHSYGQPYPTYPPYPPNAQQAPNMQHIFTQQDPQDMQNPPDTQNSPDPQHPPDTQNPE